MSFASVKDLYSLLLFKFYQIRACVQSKLVPCAVRPHSPHLSFLLVLLLMLIEFNDFLKLFTLLKVKKIKTVSEFLILSLTILRMCCTYATYTFNPLFLNPSFLKDFHLLSYL